LDYINIAKSSGFDVVDHVIKAIDDFESIVKDIYGLKFVCVKCGLDNETPRPPLGIVRVKEF
jgi:phosphonopyruvate decarboxylase